MIENLHKVGIFTTEQGDSRSVMAKQEFSSSKRRKIMLSQQLRPRHTRRSLISPWFKGNRAKDFVTTVLTNEKRGGGAGGWGSKSV